MRSLDFYNCPNTFSRITALGSTQPLTEMRTRNLPGGKGRPVPKADNLTVICEPIVKKMWEPRRVTTPGAFMACYLFFFLFSFEIAFVYYIMQVVGKRANFQVRQEA
jgi:hypothetical protein